MGDGQPIGHYDDVWAGWCTKVICDHLGLGVTTGYPTSGTTDVLPKECTSVQKCYIEMSKQVRDKLSKTDPYFTKLADVMVTWIKAWDDLNPPNASLPNGQAKAK
ncbi:hypothetical protein OPV22_027734 [Ensete ventricosum]|uniref:Uncharacterized protein n=1 Tax=Ensete ventricosum TaxID=4639 RepID=A0AAV8P394_ENSVE|nr:hypothetical protein OPV22_027734 [Ensete ventricosum]